MSGLSAVEATTRSTRFKGRMKRLTVRGLTAGIRLYTCYSPIELGKTSLVDGFARRYLTWRKFKSITRTRYGFAIETWFADIGQSYIYFFGVWEPHISRYIARHLHQGDIFIDIGANIGYYSLLAAGCVGKSGKVISIEASPTIFEYLRGNVGLNGFSNVSLHNVAIADHEGVLDLYLNESSPGQSTIMSDRVTPAHLREETRCARLGAAIDPELVQAARFIKIDVEGAEWPVVSSMEDIIGKCSSDTEFLIEVNAPALLKFGTTVAAFVGLFQRSGFAAYELTNNYDLQDYVGGKYQPPRRLLDLNFVQKDILFSRKLDATNATNRGDPA